jgi:hypothetical protein
MYVKANNTAVRTLPYSESDDGETTYAKDVAYSKNTKVTVTDKVTNSHNSVWYKISSGYWIYSGNLSASKVK